MRGRSYVYSMLARAALGACAGVCAMGAGCSERPTGAPQVVAAPWALERTYHSGDGASGPDLSVTLKVDRLIVTPADRITLLLEANSANDSPITLPTVGDHLGDCVVASARQEPDAATLSTHRRLVLSLEPFLSGKKVIPSLEISASGVDGGGGGGAGRGARASIKTDPVELDVRSVLGVAGDVTTLAPAKPPVGMGRERGAGEWKTLGFAAGAVAACGAALGWGLLSARKERRPLIDAGTVARAEIEAVARSLEGDAGRGVTDTRAACAELGAAMRRFVQRRWGVPATTLSVEQLRKAVLERGGKGDSAGGDEGGALADVCDLLTDLDLVRFSPFPPERPNTRALVDRARTWLEGAAGSIESRTGSRSSGGAA